MLKHPSCAGWHGTSNANWFFNTACGFVRGSNGVFAFNGAYGSWTDEALRGRGVAVVKSAVRA